MNLLSHNKTMNMKRTSISTNFTSKVMMILALGMTGSVCAQDVKTEQQRKGLQISIEVDKRDEGFGDTRSNLVMVLSNAYGQSSSRSMRTKILEQEDDGDKSLLTFDEPKDVKGTSFLSFTHKVGPDTQWLYLPALKRVKRISSTNKSGPFVGSEFAYEDISSQEVEKYTYKYLRDEELDDRDHYVIERDPVDPKSGYSKQEVWVDKDEYRVWKTEYYDRKGDHLKTLIYSGYELHLDKYWRANLWTMTNHQTGKGTELHFSEWVFRNGYDDKDFSKTSLAKVR